MNLGGNYMSEEKGIISVHSDDISYYDLQSALSKNDDSILLSHFDDESKRGFQDVEWIMFTLMSIPVAESVFNIVLAIKNEIKNRVSKKMTSQNITKCVKINVKIKLPFFSYEKEEEICVDPTENK